MAVIRPYREGDAEEIAALTLAAVRETALTAYSPAQVAAWSASYSVQRLMDGAARGDVILVAVAADDQPLAYTVLEADGHLDMLYCHPAHTGKGLAVALLAAAETEARGRGLTCLFTEASELARPVFTRAGYVLLNRRDFTIPVEGGEVAIHNYAMEKRLGSGAGRRGLFHVKPAMTGQRQCNDRATTRLAQRGEGPRGGNRQHRQNNPGAAIGAAAVPALLVEPPLALPVGPEHVGALQPLESAPAARAGRCIGDGVGHADSARIEEIGGNPALGKGPHRNNSHVAPPGPFVR